MNAIRVVPDESARVRLGGHGCGRLVGSVVLLLVLGVGISPLLAQAATERTPQTTTTDPNSAASKDPNAPTSGGTATDPNRPLITDPNRVRVIDPNQTLITDPNQVLVSDPNQVLVSDPNQVLVSDPNKVPADANRVPEKVPNQVSSTEPNTCLFNQPGNILIADQLNHRVVEVDRATHEIVWQFGDGNCVAGPRSVVAPHDAQRVGEWTLICGTGTATNGEPNSTGSPDNRVLLVDRSGKIIWQYGHTGVAGAEPNQLNTPMCAIYLPYGHILIADQGNHRVIEVSMITKQIVWQYGTTETPGTQRNYLHSPSSVQWLDNGNVLIADQGNNRVIEVNRRHRIVWSYGDAEDSSALSGPAYACRLPDNHTLITDSGNNRVVEVNRHGDKILEYATNKQTGSVADPLVWRAVRLKNGNTLISDQFNHQVLEIDSQSNLVFSQGTPGAAGSGPDQLNGPCDAKVIGDYTGLTSPALDSYCDWSDAPEPPDQDQGDNWRGSRRGSDGESWNHARGRF